MSWILPDGTVIKQPRVGKMFQLPGENVNHPEQNLVEWSKQGCLLEYNIYNYIEKGYNKKYYTSTGTKETVSGDTKTVEHTVKPRFKIKKIKRDRIREMRSMVSGLFRPYRWFYERAQDEGYSVPEDVKSYKTLVRTECEAIEKEILALKKYEDVVDFVFHDRWPDPPDVEDPIK